MVPTCGRSPARNSVSAKRTWVPPTSAATILTSLIPALADQHVDESGVGKGRGIPKASEVILRDLTKNTPHDLARAGFWQCRREVEMIGGGDRADLAPNLLAQLRRERVARCEPRDEGHRGVNALALDVVRIADHRRFGDGRMGNQRRFDLGGAHAMA